MAREATAITALRRELGDRLAAFRKAAGMTQAELAAAVYCDRTRIAHLEKGRGAADGRFWRAVDVLLNADGLLVKGEQQCRAAQRDHENRQRQDALDTVRGRIDGWRQDSLSPDVEGALRAATDWLDARTRWPVGTSRQRVAQCPS